MLYAILSDIHANYEALRAVEEDARRVAEQEGCELSFVCLGDVVDYGPQPNECMEWVGAHAEIVIQGNHDKAVAAPFYEPPSGIASDYWPITLWTRRVLRPEFKPLLQAYPPKKRGLAGLENFTLVHSTLKADDLYIDFTLKGRENLDNLKTYYCLFGHTHYQGYFMERGPKVIMGLTCSTSKNKRRASRPRNWRALEFGKWTPLPGRWYPTLFNPGSVGQPRRHGHLIGAGVPLDNRAAYMLLRIDEEKKEQGAGAYQFRRVSYDFEKTIRILQEVMQDVEWEEQKTIPELSHPNTQKLIRVLKNIPQLLPQLIESALIPKLRNG